MANARRKSAKRKPERKYTGVLVTPLNIPLVGLLPTPFDPNAEKKIAEHQTRVLSELFAFFSINKASPYRWKELAIALARKHVPGMTIRLGVRRRGGAKAKWSGKLGNDLIEALDSLMKREQITSKEAAAKKLLRTPKWRFLNDPKTVTARYRQARAARKRRRAPPFGPLDAAYRALPEEATD